jgi:hypothetical protein
MAELSVLIPSRNERWLNQTITDVLAHATRDTEVIVVLDGAWPEDPIAKHSRVHVVYQPVSIGQRAATNLAAKLSQAPYLMKLDAHCNVAPGFDDVLIRCAETLGPKTIQVPAQYNLHCFDWICDTCQERTYQGPTPTACPKCQGLPHHREVIWKIRQSRLTVSWRFDRNLHFQYWGEYKNRPENQVEFLDVMSCLGACWFVSAHRYWEIGGLDEGHGSWGQMGTEIACKSWLSGGRLVCNKRTWFGHMFRTQGGDFGFPYPLSGSAVDRARKHSKSLWLDGRWPQAIRPLSWMIEKFAPVPDWTTPETGADTEAQRARERADLEDPEPITPQLSASIAPVLDIPLPPITWPSTWATTPSKGLIYYTDSRLDPDLMQGVQRQLVRACAGLPIVAVGLAPFVWPEATVITLPRPRGYETMFHEILTALEAQTTDVVFFCEHDVLYSASHFTFTPLRRDTYYYNQAVWRVDALTGRAVTYVTKQTSGLCADRGLLIRHYRERLRRIAAAGGKYPHQMGFEPGSHGRPQRVDDVPSAVWQSTVPNVDIRLPGSLTPSRWSPAEFRNARSCRGWIEADGVPGWGVTKGRFAEFFQEQTPGQVKEQG